MLSPETVLVARGLEPVRESIPGCRPAFIAGPREHRLGGEQRARRAPEQLAPLVLEVGEDELVQPVRAPGVAGEAVAHERDPALAAEVAGRVSPLLASVRLAAVSLEGAEHRVAPARRAALVQRPGQAGHAEVDRV